jgi:hypothetical protein
MADVAQTFSIDPYAAENARLSRQQKLAEILQQQALQPDQQFSYAGIQAPASAAGALAKGLQSGISGYMMGRSMKGQEDLISKASEDTKSATEALVKGLSAKPWQNPDAGAVGTAPIYQPGASGLRDANDPAPQPQMMPGADQSTAAFKAGPAGSYSGALASLGDLPDNPQAQRLAQSLLMKKLEKDSATTKLGPEEKVYDANGKLLFGNDPKSQSALGKLADDYKNGRITKAEYDAGVAKETSFAPPPQVQVNSYLPASEEAQKQFLQSARMTYDQLKQAPVALQNIEQAKALVPSAAGFMGPGGDTLLNAAKFLNNRVGTSINIEGIKNAEELRSRIFENVMDNLKKMDASPSQQQQAVMQKALGSLDTDPAALPQVLDSFANIIRGKIDLHNQEMQGAIERGVKFPYDPIIKAPAPTNAGASPIDDLVKKYGGKR